ncbi:MAG: cupin domain-containing protein [Acidimicrobiia bacterium]
MYSSQVVVPCDELQSTVDWFLANTGFRMVLIRPADDPSIAVLDGYGISIRLDREAADGPSSLLLAVDELPSDRVVTAPNGTVIQFVLSDPPFDLPPNRSEFVSSRSADADFSTGRAGMTYRDLIPARQGGRFIASHIRIPEGGPVPDYVHHHHIRFQMIFCHQGWADLVYEDQGPQFRFEAGDCVLQPPHIRHRVLATSDAFEVVEIGCPAEHDTLRDNEMTLPTSSIDRDRDFGGQRFVWHRAASAVADPWHSPGFDFINFGIDQATDGLATVGIVRAGEEAEIGSFSNDSEFLFWFVRAGAATLTRNGEDSPIGPRDAITFAPDETYSLTDVSPDLELLEVKL